SHARPGTSKKRGPRAANRASAADAAASVPSPFVPNRSQVRRDFVSEFGSNHDVNETGCRFYQTSRRSFIALKFAPESEEGESQLRITALPETWTVPRRSTSNRLSNDGGTRFECRRTPPVRDSRLYGSSTGAGPKESRSRCASNATANSLLASPLGR